MFKDGDKAILVSTHGWSGDRNYQVVCINKVHKTGRLTIEGDRDQWRLRKGNPDHFVKCNGYYSSELHVYSKKLLAELTNEREMSRDRNRLNRLGDRLNRIRDREEASEIWKKLPADVQALIEGET